MTKKRRPTRAQRRIAQIEHVNAALNKAMDGLKAELDSAHANGRQDKASIETLKAAANLYERRSMRCRDAAHRAMATLQSLEGTLQRLGSEAQPASIQLAFRSLAAVAGDAYRLVHEDLKAAVQP